MASPPTIETSEPYGKHRTISVDAAPGSAAAFPVAIAATAAAAATATAAVAAAEDTKPKKAGVSFAQTPAQEHPPTAPSNQRVAITPPKPPSPGGRGGRGHGGRGGGPAGVRFAPPQPLNSSRHSSTDSTAAALAAAEGLGATDSPDVDFAKHYGRGRGVEVNRVRESSDAGTLESKSGVETMASQSQLQVRKPLKNPLDCTARE